MSIKNILISQATPLNLTAYSSLTEKFGVNIKFQPFFVNEALTSREFRLQKINILDYTAIVFSARHMIDAFFSISEDLRIKIPETMKYFCTTEPVAMYLQKHIVFRKRKIFFGNGTPASMMDAIGTKHSKEKFLFTMAENGNPDAYTTLFDQAGIDYQKAVFVKPVFQDLKSLDIDSFDLAVVYNPADIKSLQENFPEFSCGKMKFITFGKKVVSTMTEAGYPIEIQAPTPEAPSAARAIELYLEAHNA